MLAVEWKKSARADLSSKICYLLPDIWRVPAI